MKKVLKKSSILLLEFYLFIIIFFHCYNISGIQFTQRHLEFLQLFEKEEMANYLRHKKSEQKDSAESKLQKR